LGEAERKKTDDVSGLKKEKKSDLCGPPTCGLKETVQQKERAGEPQERRAENKAIRKNPERETATRI